MKINEFMTESFQTVSINGILRSLNNDEKKIYTKVKENGKLLKSELDEFDQRIASDMVTKGLLTRRKNPQREIYFTTKGRRKCAINKPIEEVAPPDSQLEKWIEDNKEKYQEKYGKDYKRHLYGKAWFKFNGKKLTESFEDNKINEDTVFDHSWYEVEDGNYPKRTKEGIILKEDDEENDFANQIIEKINSEPDLIYTFFAKSNKPKEFKLTEYGYSRDKLYFHIVYTNDTTGIGDTWMNAKSFQEMYERGDLTLPFETEDYWDGEDEENLMESENSSKIQEYKDSFLNKNVKDDNNTSYTIIDIFDNNGVTFFKVKSEEDEILLATPSEMKDYFHLNVEDYITPDDYWDGENEDELMETVYTAKYNKGQCFKSKATGKIYQIRYVHFDNNLREYYYEIGELHGHLVFNVLESNIENKYEEAYENDTDEDYWDGEDED